MKNHENPGTQPIDDTGSFLCAHDPYFTLIQEPENDTELVIVTLNEAFNDTIAENDAFVAPNYDYVTTLASMKTVESMNGNNFINARRRPFHPTQIRFGKISDIEVSRVRGVS